MQILEEEAHGEKDLVKLDKLERPVAGRAEVVQGSKSLEFRVWSRGARLAPTKISYI